MKRSKGLYNFFCVLYTILFLIFLSSIIFVVILITSLCEYNPHGIMISMIAIMFDVAIILPLALYFTGKALDCDPNPPKRTFYDPMDPPYKDWY